jgi:hypothetical protein
MARLTGLYGGCLLLSAMFPPDPVPDFPGKASGATVSTSGVLVVPPRVGGRRVPQKGSPGG